MSFKTKRRRGVAAGLLTAALLAGSSGLAQAGVGGGGVGGGGGAGGAARYFKLIVEDNASHEAIANPHQGTEQASINYFLGLVKAAPMPGNYLVDSKVNEACTIAIANAKQRSSTGNRPSRVVAVGIALDTADGGVSYAPWGSTKEFFKSSFDTFWGDSKKYLENYDDKYINLVYNAFVENIAPSNAKVTCVAVNDEEVRPPDYVFTAATKLNRGNAAVGNAEPVFDEIWGIGGNGENLDGISTLYWDMPEGGIKQVDKPVKLISNGYVYGPTFTPADFGATTWTGGRWWFDLWVPKQGKMRDLYNSPDRLREESWEAPLPSPTKKLYTVDGVEITKEQAALGMPYVAKIKAKSSGYTHMTIGDLIKDTSVHVCAPDKDITDCMKVTRADGTTVPATFGINILGDGFKHADANIANAGGPTVDQELTLELTVYPSRKGAYTMLDAPIACYNNAVCNSGGDVSIKKPAPKPNKSWVADPSQALATDDSEWSNQTGTDTKVYAPGAVVYSVVNDKLPAWLAAPLHEYHIYDKWAVGKNTDYLSCADTSLAKVYMGDKDVTAQFTIEDKDGTTSAYAQPEFLKSTANIDTTPMKLIIGCAFKAKLDTKGEAIELRNEGGVTWNNEHQPTNVPPIYVRTPAPHKTVVDEPNKGKQAVNINGKKLFMGDMAVYEIILDANPARAKRARDVFKLGIKDNYDEEYLSLKPEDIKVIVDDPGATTLKKGQTVTDKFNIGIVKGEAYVMFKTVDTVPPPPTAPNTGVVVQGAAPMIKGNPQPTDLAAYYTAPIDRLTQPAIDQAMLGAKYKVILPAKVIKEKEGYSLKNIAEQNVDNFNSATEQVVNPLVDIDPSKDVVADVTTKDKSLNGTTIDLYSTFNYQLNSSILPGNRVYDAKSWTINDTFVRAYDQYLGVWAVYAQTDIYDGKTVKFKTGELIADSKGKNADLFTATFNEETYTFDIAATEAFLKLVSSSKDKTAGFTVYTQMKRIAPADKVVNVLTETYNGTPRPSQEVVTNTPEDVGIAVVKYTEAEGRDAGDRDTSDVAYKTKDVTKVGFAIKNTGNVDLIDVTVVDTTIPGTEGAVQDVVCELPEGKTGGFADIKTIARGAEVHCTGTLPTLNPSALHGDNVVATGKSKFTGKEVSAEDPWYAQAPPAPVGIIAGLADPDNPGKLWALLGLLAASGACATAAVIKVKSSKSHGDDTVEEGTTPEV